MVFGCFNLGWSTESKINIGDTSTANLEKILFNRNASLEKRIETAKILGEKRGDKKAIEILKRSLNIENKKIQIESAISLYKLNEGTIALPVIDAYIKEGHNEVLGKLFKQKDFGKAGEGHIYQIMGLYNESGRIILKNALKYNDITRARAASYLVTIGEETLAYQVAIESLKNSKDVNAKLWSLEVLVKIADKKSKEAIENALNDKNEEVKKRAQWMLNYLKNKEIQKEAIENL